MTMPNSPMPSAPAPSQPHRRRLPTTRPSITHKRAICGFELYVTVSFFDDASPGGGTDPRHACDPAEVFVTMAKHGSDLGGVMDGLAVTLSLALQYGVPWPKIAEKYRHTRFGEGDGSHTSLLDGLAQVVDFIVEQRRGMLGDEPPTAGAPVPAPPKPQDDGAICGGHTLETGWIEGPSEVSLSEVRKAVAKARTETGIPPKDPMMQEMVRQSIDRTLRKVDSTLRIILVDVIRQGILSGFTAEQIVESFYAEAGQ